MAAYNFQKRFVDAILSGEKTHTIRRIGKRTHSKPGQPIQLYTGMRTKACRKIIDPDPTCLRVDPISINVRDHRIWSVIIPGWAYDSVHMLDKFAIEDGFKNADDMHKFWLDFHGTGRFDGLFISWTPPEISDV